MRRAQRRSRPGGSIARAFEKIVVVPFQSLWFAYATRFDEARAVVRRDARSRRRHRRAQAPRRRPRAHALSGPPALGRAGPVPEHGRRHWRQTNRHRVRPRWLALARARRSRRGSPRTGTRARRHVRRSARDRRTADPVHADRVGRRRRGDARSGRTLRPRVQARLDELCSSRHGRARRGASRYRHRTRARDRSDADLEDAIWTRTIRRPGSSGERITIHDDACHLCTLARDDAKSPLLDVRARAARVTARARVRGWPLAHQPVLADRAPGPERR